MSEESQQNAPDNEVAETVPPGDDAATQDAVVESDHGSDTDQNIARRNPPRPGSDEARIDELLDEWEATNDAGEPIPVETLCQEEPQLIPQIRERVAALQAVDRKLAERKKKNIGLLPRLRFGTLIDNMKFLSAGGLGEVFVGEDDNLHRRVAIKFMHSHLCENSERQGQFALEAEITGRLEHPGIVPLYGFGKTDDDRPFYAMRFIEGETLDDAVKRYFKHLEAAAEQGHDKSKRFTWDKSSLDVQYDLELEFRRLLSHFVSVCKTIAYAHNRGVVHRDIKPANIMIGRFGETIVVDWGLAVPVMRDERFRSSGEETLALSPSGSHTGSTSGRGSGTPAFMSPEQFSELAPTPASDIYSLGATLFVLLCGKPPILHKTISEIRSDTIEGRLPALNEIRKGISKQLQAIVYKAMEKDPKNRYPTALELAKDVERYLADEPVSAYQDSLGLKVARMARRHRIAAQASVMGLLACLLIAGVSALFIKSEHSTAESLRARNLETSAEFIARACGYEIDRIWRVLEYEANSPELQAMVAACNEMIQTGEPVTVDNQMELHHFLQQRLMSQSSISTLSNLCVLSQDGTQVGRVPLPQKPQVGQNFAFRDYFTGLGFDLEPGSKMAKFIDEPLAGPDVHESGVHMSAAYLSTQADEQFLKVTYTVPIRITNADGSTQTIGVIGTSVRVGDVMAATQIGDSKTWIADLGEDDIGDGSNDPNEEGRRRVRRRGLILHYPKTVARNEASKANRLSSNLVEQLQNQDYTFDEMTNEDWLQASSSHYSIQPVTISGRGEKPHDVGWIVVTAE